MYTSAGNIIRFSQISKIINMHELKANRIGIRGQEIWTYAEYSENKTITQAAINRLLL